MIKNVIDYLENSAKEFSDKIAYSDESRAITFSLLKHEAQQIASGIITTVRIGEPVIVLMSKCVEAIECFLGISYTGAFYVPVDISMPAERIDLILKTLSAKVIITKRTDSVNLDDFNSYRFIYVEDLFINEHILTSDIHKRQLRVIDTDPAYAIFTSGSTGIPKGVLVSQRSVINFTEWWCETFDFNSEEIFANQTPFYFDASVKDIYATLRCGATMHIVPKKLFSLPKKLIHYLNEKHVTCIDWVPSALCMIVNFGALEKETPKYLRKIMFLGEVMPTKQYNMWKKALPYVEFANLYGPTEATGDCTYYKIEREFADDEPIPIGFPCANTDVMLMDEDNLITEFNRPGEICVRGCSLALGYYNNINKTDEVFVQNPLQHGYKERIYRTGDIGMYNSYGEIVFLSRKDSQIKHMGHRIELGEIESALSAIKDIRRSCCLYDNDKQLIIAIYEGDVDKSIIIKTIKDKLPNYMIPNSFICIDEVPVNPNGKIDRSLLIKKYIKEDKNQHE